MWARFSALALVLGAAQADAQDTVRFSTIEVPDHAYTGGWEHYVGGGLAVFDCDDDGRLDLFAAGGDSAPALWRNTSDSNISFTALPALDVSATTGAYPIDIDSDGHLDLMVLRVGPDRVLKGDGQCGFAPMTLPGVQFADRWSTAFSATWEGTATWPTLAIGHYVDRTDPDGPFEACDSNTLLRPIGETYHEITLTPGFCPLSMLISDWDRNGTADLRVSNDRHYYVKGGAEQMWQLSDTPRLFDDSDGWTAHQLWGMGIAERDLDRDGLMEVFLSSMGDQRLQEWTGTGATFKDVPFARGAAAHRPYTGGDGRPSTGWHIAFGDVQNDGMDDVFIAKGNVQQMPGMAMDDPNNLLIQSDDGSFSEAGLSAGIASLHRARGAALADFNNDGKLDLAVVNRVAPLEIWQNTTADTKNWISVDVRQTGPNTRATGGWIEVMDDMGLQVRPLTIGGGHAGGMAGPEHFGLDRAETGKLRVIWPDQTMSDWLELTANHSYKIIRDDTGTTVTKRP